MKITDFYHPVIPMLDISTGCWRVHGCVSHSEMFTSQVKKEEETGSSLTPALSHGGVASATCWLF